MADSAFNLLKEEYVALRAEICQSIAKQHQIMLAGYALTAAVLGYVVGSDNSHWQSLAVIPLVLLAMTSLWTCECNRMVRASYYIGYVLWPSMKRAAQFTEHAVGWEAWIRRDSGNAPKFRRIQNHLQLLVVLAVPFVASGTALVMASPSLWATSASLVILLWLASLGLWILVASRVVKVSDLGAITADEETGDCAAPDSNVS